MAPFRLSSQAPVFPSSVAPLAAREVTASHHGKELPAPVSQLGIPRGILPFEHGEKGILIHDPATKPRAPLYSESWNEMGWEGH